MKEAFWKVSNALMASVITLLGYTGCRSAQQRDSIESVYGPPPEYEEELLQQRLDAEKQAQMEKEEKERLRREQRIKVVYGPPQSYYRKAKADADGVYDVVEQMPHFEGDDQPQKWIQQNLRYPAKAKQQREEGRVIVSFIVRDNGQIDGVTVVKSVSPLLDQEAIRVIKSMPRWQPGMQDGEAVNVRYALPVNFRLPR